jgi:D-glycero-D-manno-heptose 1,7-bisphosphate phosphatase
VHVYPGIPEAFAKLKAAGFRIFVVSNQSGIGRGLMTLEQHQAVQQEFLRQIGPGLIDACYFCPDPPGMPSTRRKPEPGMVLEAAAEFAIDLPNSWLIGDKAADIECGHRAGLRTIQVATGYGAQQPCESDFRAGNAVAAIQICIDFHNSRC